MLGESSLLPQFARYWIPARTAAMGANRPSESNVLHGCGVSDHEGSTLRVTATKIGSLNSVPFPLRYQNPRSCSEHGVLKNDMIVAGTKGRASMIMIFRINEHLQQPTLTTETLDAARYPDFHPRTMGWILISVVLQGNPHSYPYTDALAHNNRWE